MKTVSETAKLLGSENFRVLLGGLRVDVRILDVKQSYGRTRYQVAPVSGVGSVWVENVYQKEAQS